VQVGEGGVAQADVTASAIAARPGALDQPGRVEDVKVVSEQVRFEPELMAEFHRCAVGGSQLVDDGKPHGVAERSVSSGALVERSWFGHSPTLPHNRY
jgi:hypothetical protein